MAAELDWSIVEAVVVDSDGVLTDGGVFVSDLGGQYRRFCIKDGAGIVALQKTGILFAIVSSSPCTCVQHRARQLGVTELHLGVKDKWAVVETMLASRGVPSTRVVYVGDDLIDLTVMARVGFPCAVEDAVPAVRARAAYVTRAKGGHGAIREIAELILARRADGATAGRAAVASI